MNIPSPGSRKKPRIEIIPLIDIMFFLLATFLITYGWGQFYSVLIFLNLSWLLIQI